MEVGSIPVPSDEVVLELVRKRLTAVGAFSWDMLSATIVEDALCARLDQLCVRLETEMLCQSLDHKQHTVAFWVPATWWQHLRQAAFPRWWLSRYPVRLKKLSETVYYEILDSYPQADIVVPELGKPVRLALRDFRG